MFVVQAVDDLVSLAFTDHGAQQPQLVRDRRRVAAERPGQFADRAGTLSQTGQDQQPGGAVRAWSMAATAAAASASSPAAAPVIGVRANAARQRRRQCPAGG
jgi:hypothetical protein